MERQRTARIPRKLVLVVVVVVVLGAILWAQNSTVLAPDMSYAVVDQRTITVAAAVAPCSWTRVTSVTETPTEVRVKVETLPCPILFLAQTDELTFRDLTVSLAADLGTRVVEDANGQPVSQR